MDRLIERCAGLDVHKATVTACVRVPGDAGGRHQEIRTFSTTTAGLLTLRDWVASYGVTLVGMESTLARRVLPLGGRFHLLAAEREAPAQRPGPQDRRGRLGLDRAAGRTRPGPPVLRPAPGDPGAPGPHPVPQGPDPGADEGAQRLEKTLQDAGIKLSSVASDILGASGRAMVTALVEGTHDPEVLASLAKGALRKKLPQLKEALEAHFRGHHALLASEILAPIDYLDEAIERLSGEIEKLIAPFAEQVSRDMVCPCTTSGMSLPADNEPCTVVLAFHIHEGNVDGVDVSGLNVAVMAPTSPDTIRRVWVDIGGNTKQARKPGNLP